MSNRLELQRNHNFKVRGRRSSCANLRVPSDSHRAGELPFNVSGRKGRAAAVWAWPFLLGDVSSFALHQPEHRRARAEPPVLLRPGHVARDAEVDGQLWPAMGDDQSGVRQRDGNGGFLDLDTGEIRVGGIGPINLNGDVEMNYKISRHAASPTQWSDKTVIRAGYGRSFDIGVFGSVFGHAVTQNLPVLAAQDLNPRPEFRPGLHLQLPAGAQMSSFNRNQRDRTLPAAERRFSPRRRLTRARSNYSRRSTPELTAQHQ